ncbi:ras GEF [Sporormia fimetaria CBS 119925]|uniref:Ras GEF n=1 Tax=Sporormia fimetaria CBS 119925 TaxID=1340428 RepID=A0A6A6V593_9PLEO|nr:ras GEF [Sporormia fimetaria CBS 119925]
MDDFVLETNEGNKHASALVAPLNIQKSPKKSRGKAQHTRQASSRGSLSSRSHSHSQSQPSPPLTPRTSLHSLPEPPPVHAIFHNYLRAFCQFHPTSTVSSQTEESSITVPINRGDLILVHSVHSTGWADGTVLTSGQRGWLPTNYCEPYEHHTIQNLLDALALLFDLIKDAEDGDLAVFTRQDYVRAMIAGVRYFLEQTHCLTRDSSLILRHVGLRRMRKGLLGDLSSLVKTSKKLQEQLQSGSFSLPIFEQSDELVLKAYKLVTRAVRFLDIWAEDSLSQSYQPHEVNSRPPTPPSESLDTAVRFAAPASLRASVAQASVVATQETPDSPSRLPRSLTRLSVAFSTPSESDALQSPTFPPQAPGQAKRTSVAHRLSYTGKAQGLRKQNLASERLRAAQDDFVGYLGSFIGLHLHSRSSEELVNTTRQSVIACHQLLAVVEEVWERDSRRSEPLDQARQNMQARLTEVVQATKELFRTSDPTVGENMVMEDSGRQLVAAATSCVRSAGECVTQACSVIERIGDFEFEHVGLGISDSIFEQFDHITHKFAESSSPSRLSEKDKPLPAPPESARQLAAVLSGSKPLPEVPIASPLHTITLAIPKTPSAVSLRLSGSSNPATDCSSPALPAPGASDVSQSPASAIQRFFSKTPVDSVHASPCDTGSFMSYDSTRATTPETTPAKYQSPQALTGSFGSASELGSLISEDVASVEGHLMRRTYVNELTFKEDGQIMGGSLPALVEQLTTHEVTPDLTFVTAFYLTFRLFTTPVELAQCLISRFDYVGDHPTVAPTVRLRVYNSFKAWLETHWLAESDSPALGIILAFATGKLRAALPAAGKRLAELTSRVAEVRGGAPVLRTSSALTLVDDDVPIPQVTKSQLNLLKNVIQGKNHCTILDFEPLELARQLTIIESNLFCAMRAEELLGLEWTKKNSTKAIHVRAMSTLSTDLANLVADTILSLEDAKKRAATIKHWVKVAQKCLDLGNYDSLMAITCSINSSVVSRLKKTWDIVSNKTKGRLEELKLVTEVSRNYAVLRQRLNNHAAPCIPFVGMYLTDLTFVDAGNASVRQLRGTEGPEVINFDKYMKTAKIIGQLQSFQQPYCLVVVPEMQEWLETQIARVHKSDEANIQSFHRRSVWLEPREQAQAAKSSPATENGAHGGLLSTNRNGSKERFDFLNFTFVPLHMNKER